MDRRKETIVTEAGAEEAVDEDAGHASDSVTDDGEIIARLAEDPRVLKMKQFIQHGRVTTYDHCLAVAKMSARMDRIFHLHAHRKDLIRGAFLHDYYLYDWHVHGDHLHGFHHPAIACRKASEDFGLDEREKKIILSHMWPLTFFHAPSCREAVIVCIADKVCSTKETLFCR